MRWTRRCAASAVAALAAAAVVGRLPATLTRRRATRVHVGEPAPDFDAARGRRRPARPPVREPRRPDAARVLRPALAEQRSRYFADLRAPAPHVLPARPARRSAVCLDRLGRRLPRVRPTARRHVHRPARSRRPRRSARPTGRRAAPRPTCSTAPARRGGVFPSASTGSTIDFREQVEQHLDPRPLTAGFRVREIAKFAAVARHRGRRRLRRSSRSRSGRATASSPGAAAPDFRLPALARRDRATCASLRGRVVLLNFWATWCAPCVEEMPSLERLAPHAAARRGWSWSAVSADEDEEAVRGLRAARHGLTFPMLRDRGRADRGRLPASPATRRRS